MTRGLSKTIGLWLAFVAGAGVVVPLTAPSTLGFPASEYEVKAAYLYNFGRFVEWPPRNPATPTNDFAICVMGHDPFGTALDSTISGEKIDGKNVVARRVSNLDEATNCRILFVGSSESKQLKEIVSTAGKMNMLTVSDMPEFIQQGGMVQFVVMDARVRFEINLAATREAGLNLSSELLKVAAAVRGKPKSGN